MDKEKMENKTQTVEEYEIQAKRLQDGLGEKIYVLVAGSTLDGWSIFDLAIAILDLVEKENSQIKQSNESYAEGLVNFIVEDANRIHQEAQNKYPKGSNTSGTFWLGSSDLKRYIGRLFEQYKSKESEQA